MAGEPLVEELVLDIAPALDALTPLGTALTDLAEGFTTTLSDALSSLSGVQPIGADQLIDTSGIAPSIDDAIAGAAPAPVPVDGDPAALETSISDAIESPWPPIPVEGDAEPLTAAIDEATSVSATVPVDGDTTAAKDSIAQLQGETVSVTIDVDAADAQATIEDLGQSATVATGSGGGSGGGGSGLSGLEGAVVGVQAASSGADAAVGTLSEGISSVGASSTIAALGGGAAFAAFLTESVSLAADAEAQNKRFTQTFADMGIEIENINVGGLSISFKDLATQTGTTEANLEATTTKLGMLGENAGATKDQISQTVQQVLALGGTLSANNPRLGDAADVTDKLQRALATGGRFAAQLGLSLQSADIKARAQEIAGAGNEVTRFDLITAGAQLSVEQFGGSLGTKFAAGAQNAEVQLRSLKTQVEETLVALGGPLLAPVVDTFKALTPVAQELGTDLGEVGQILVDTLGSVAPILTPVAAVLGLVGDGLHVVADVVHEVPGPVLAAAVAVAALSANFIAGAPEALAWGAAIDFAMGPVGIAVGVLAALGLAVDLAGGSQDSTAEAAKRLGDALFGEVHDAESLQKALGDLDTNLKSTEQHFIDTLPAAARSLLTAAGGADAVTAAISGTNRQFDQFVKDQVAATNASKGLAATVLAPQIKQGLEEQRKAFIDNEKAQLDGLVTSHQLTQSQLDQIEANHKAEISQGQYTGALKEAATAASKAADAQASLAKETFTGNVQSGAVAALVAQFEAGKIGAAEFGQKLTDLGADANAVQSITKDLTAAQTAQADASLLQSDAARQVEVEFAQGKISAAQLEGALFSMGVSASGSKSEVDQLSKSLDNFKSAIDKSLPTAKDAISEYAKTASADFAKVEQDSKSHSKSLQKDFKQLAVDSDPKVFIKNLQDEITQIQQFQTNIDTLAKEGFTQLAATIAEQGPAVGGGLAAALASDKNKAALSQALIGNLDTARTNATNDFTGKLGVWAAMGGAAGNALSSGFQPDLGGPTDAQVNKAQQVIADHNAALAHNAAVLGESGSIGYTGALQLHGPTDAQVKAAQAVLDAHQRVQGSAAGLGAAATSGFTGALGLPAGVKPSIDAVGAVFGDPQARVNALNQARSAGHAIGALFDIGLASGIAAGESQVITAAANAAAAAEAAAKKKLGIRSPSQVGIEIGTQFVQGIEVGVRSESSALADTTAGLVGSFSTNVAANAADVAAAKARLAELQAADTAAAAAKAAADAAAAKAAQDAENAARAAQQAIDSFVSGATSKLPTAGDALQQYAQNVDKARQTLAAARKQQTADTIKFQQDQTRLKIANDATQRDQVAVNNLYGKLLEDQAHHASGAVIAADKARLKSAQDTLAADKKRSADLAKSLHDDQTALTQSGKAVKAAQDQLAKASDPANVANTIAAQSAQIKAFQDDINALVAAGDRSLAEQLASAGPQVAGALADLFAHSPAKAAAAESAIDAAQGFVSSYTGFLDSTLGPAVGASIQNGVSAAVAATPVLTSSPQPGTAVAVGAGAGATSTTQTIVLDVSIKMPDGSELHAKPVTIPVAPPSTLPQRVVAEVQAL